MRIIERRIETIGNEVIEVSLIERTSRKWIAGIILLSIIVIGLEGFMFFLLIKSLSLDWLHQLLAFVGNIAGIFMILIVSDYLTDNAYPQERILSVEVL